MSVLSATQIKPKIYLCSSDQTEASKFERFRLELKERGFEAFPNPAEVLPGMNWRTIQQRQLRESDLYLVFASSVEGAAWDPGLLTTLQSKLSAESPWILPVIESPAGYLPDGVSDLKALYVKGDLFKYGWGFDEVVEAINALLAIRQRPRRVEVGSHGYISKIELLGFFAFAQRQILDLRSPANTPARWTVILGDNGTGKTTLLRAIAACGAGAPEQWRDEARHCSIRVVQRLDRESREFLINAKSEALDDLRPVCFGYGAGRRAVAARLSADPAGPSATLFSENVELPDAEEWFLQTDHALRVKGKPTAEKHFQQVKTVLIRLLPDVTDIKVESEGHRTRVSVQMHGSWYPMSSMSLGYKTALTWMVDLARRMFDRYPDSPAPLEEPAVVLIDEIDLHLHPRWQRSLLQVLDETFTKTQFIVTAHSPLIVQAAPKANLVLLRRDGDQIVIDNDKDYVRDWRIDQILASELFGGQPVHSSNVERLLNERADLLRADGPPNQERLSAINSELEQLPTATLPEDQEAMDLIREAAKLIQSK